MLESISDVDRLASTAIRVEHFATREVMEVPHDGRLSEVRAWMEVNDFDVAPLQGQQKPMVVLRSDLADGGEERPVQALARSVSQEQLVYSSTALPAALQVLQSYGWFLVYDENEITGIVTRSDLARPAISIYIFARMISLEHGLRRLLGSYSNTPIPDEPPDDKDALGPKYLTDVLRAIRKTPGLIEDLGFVSKKAFDNGTGFLVELRNHIAHGRSILALADNVEDAVQRIAELEGLVRKISGLLVEREQIWDAFVSTNIVQPIDATLIWSGSGAVASLPLPMPIHVITASNPFERVLSLHENHKRQEALKQLLRHRGVSFVPVLGQSADGQWSESSFAVHGLCRSEACELARQIGQRAIFELDDESQYVIGSDEVVRAQRSRIC